MIIFIVCLVAVVVAVFVALILGYQGGVSTFLSPQTDRSLVIPLAKDGHTIDLTRVRFDRAFRGYRMEQVDAMIDTLVQERLAQVGAAAEVAAPASEVSGATSGTPARPEVSAAPAEAPRQERETPNAVSDAAHGSAAAKTENAE